MLFVQARDYCMKDDTRVEGPWVYGDEPAQGKRSDLAGVKRALDEGADDSQIAESFFSDWVRYNKSFAAYRELRVKPRDFQTRCTVLWGPPGSGKTTRAQHEAGPDAYWLSNSGGSIQWWQRYRGQKHVVIDEFKGWLKYLDLLRLIDHSPLLVQVMPLVPTPSLTRRWGRIRLSAAVFSVFVLVLLRASASIPLMARTQVKGGDAHFLAEHIWILSNDPPDMWYQEGLRALKRRFEAPIGEVIHMSQIWVPPSFPLVSALPPAAAARGAAPPSPSRRRIGDAMLGVREGAAESSAIPAMSSTRWDTLLTHSDGAPSAPGRIAMRAGWMSELPDAGGSTAIASAGTSGMGWMHTARMRTPSPPVFMSFGDLEMAKPLSPRMQSEWSWHDDNVY